MKRQVCIIVFLALVIQSSFQSGRLKHADGRSVRKTAASPYGRGNSEASRYGDTHSAITDTITLHIEGFYEKGGKVPLSFSNVEVISSKKNAVWGKGMTLENGACDVEIPVLAGQAMKGFVKILFHTPGVVRLEQYADKGKQTRFCSQKEMVDFRYVDTIQINCDFWQPLAVYENARFILEWTRETLLVDNMEEITVIFPAPEVLPGQTRIKTSSSATTPKVVLEGKYWNVPQALAHELGHQVMRTIFGTSIAGGKDHKICEIPEDPALAFSEGYATAFAMISTMNNDRYGEYQVNNRDIENYVCTRQQLSTDEGRIAAALWDLYDTNNDDNSQSAGGGKAGSNGDTNQYSTLTAYQILAEPLLKQKIDNIEEYVIQLLNIFNADIAKLQQEDAPHQIIALEIEARDKAMDIFTYNWLDG